MSDNTKKVQTNEQFLEMTMLVNSVFLRNIKIQEENTVQDMDRFMLAQTGELDQLEDRIDQLREQAVIRHVLWFLETYGGTLPSTLKIINPFSDELIENVLAYLVETKKIVEKDGYYVLSRPIVVVDKSV